MKGALTLLPNKDDLKQLMIEQDLEEKPSILSQVDWGLSF